MSTTNKRSFSKSKSTARFNFSANVNESSHKAGANTITIESKDYDITTPGYSVGTTAPTAITMTVKEAQVLNRFLNKTLSV